MASREPPPKPLTKPLPLVREAPPPYRAPAGVTPEVAGAPRFDLPEGLSAAPAEATAPAAPALPAPRPLAPAEALRQLEAIYREVDRRIALLRPTCHARGICCDFDRTDHVLYATRLEVDYVKAGQPRERYARPSGNVCPFLVDGLCGAREQRMIGCRTYYCQEGWEPFGAAIYEWALGEVKAIARAFDLDWRYAPVLDQLREG